MYEEFSAVAVAMLQCRQYQGWGPDKVSYMKKARSWFLPFTTTYEFEAVSSHGAARMSCRMFIVMRIPVTVVHESYCKISQRN